MTRKIILIQNTKHFTFGLTDKLLASTN